MSDGTKDLTIRIKLDKSGAKADAQAFKADVKKIEQEILTDAQVAEKAKAEAAKQANRERIADAVAGEKKLLTDAQIAEKTKAELIRQTNRERLNASVRAAKSEQETSAKGVEGLLSMTKAAGGFALSMLGIEGAKAVLSTIVSNFDEAREAAYKASKMVNDYREDLLELAALKGKLGDTTGALKEEVAFRSKTLQSASDAKNFQSLALGVGQSSINAGNISQAEFDKAMEYTGQFQAVEKGDPRAHATLLGLTPALLGKKNATAEEVFRRDQQYYKIFQPGGPEYSDLVKQFNGIASSAAAGTYDDRQLAALLSAFSTQHVGSGEAKTTVDQFTRATLGGVDSSGKPRILDSESRGAYFKKLGVDDEFLKSTKATDLPFVIADKIVADLDAQREKQGENFSPDVYLKHEGFANLEDLGAIKDYAALKKSGALGAIMDLAKPEAEPTFEAAMQPLKRARQVDPALQARKAAYAEDLSKISVGAGKTEYAETLKRLAFARRKAGVGFGGEADRETDDTYETTRDRGTLNPSELLFGHRKRTEDEAQRLLMKEAERVGIDTQSAFALHFRPEKEGGGVLPTDDYLYKLAQEIAKRGGSVLPGFESVQGAAEHSLDTSGKFVALQQTPAMEARPAGNAAAAGGELAAVPGVAKADSKEALDVLKQIRDEQRKANAKPAATKPPAPLPTPRPAPFR